MRIGIVCYPTFGGSGMQGVKAPLFRVNNFDELEQHKNELKGKIVFLQLRF